MPLAGSAAVGAARLPIRAVGSIFVTPVIVGTPVVVAASATILARARQPRLILPSTLVPPLEGVTESLVLALVPGGQPLQQLPDVGVLREGGRGQGEGEAYRHDDGSHSFLHDPGLNAPPRRRV